MTAPWKTALVTGASAGLGVEFAKQLAARGVDLVLVARRRDRLEALAAELTGKHGVKTWVIPADLEDSAAPAAIVAEVERLGLEVDLLVNNAGFGSNGPFAELPLGPELGQIRVNVLALVELTHRLLPGMRARGRGNVLNIASTAGFQPGPLMATYFATKAFVVSFSEALSHELAGSGVGVTAHCPGATATDFFTTAGSADTALVKGRRLPSAAECVADALSATERGRAVAIHGWRNWFLAQSVRFSPRWAVARLTQQFNSRA